VAQMHEQPNTDGLGRRGHPMLLVRERVAASACRKGPDAVATNGGMSEAAGAGGREWSNRTKSSMRQATCRWNPTTVAEGAGCNAAGENHSDRRSGWLGEGFGKK
jgi:hypothetical protein